MCGGSGCTRSPRSTSSPASDLAQATESGMQRQLVAQPDQRGQGVRRHAEQRAAHPLPPGPQLAGDVLVAGDGGAGHRPEPLVERDVDAVEERGDLGEGVVEERLRLPEPGAVDVERHAELAGGLGERQRARPRSAAGSRPRAAAARAGPRRAGRWPGIARSDSAVAVSQPSVRVSNRNPCSSRGPSVSWRSWWDRSGIATRCERRRSHQTRSAACWAMVPLTKKTAAGFPSSSATSVSIRSTAPCSP